MINTKELTLERERIKDKFSELLDALIEKRSKMKKRRSRHVISMSDVNKLRESSSSTLMILIMLD